LRYEPRYANRVRNGVESLLTFEQNLETLQSVLTTFLHDTRVIRASSVVRICGKLTSAFNGERFLGIVLITLNDEPEETFRAFLLGGFCLKRQTLLSRKK
jgi:hypothetical protein